MHGISQFSINLLKKDKIKWEYFKPQLGFHLLVNFSVKMASTVGELFERDSTRIDHTLICGTHRQNMPLSPSISRKSQKA